MKKNETFPRTYSDLPKKRKGEITEQPEKKKSKLQVIFLLNFS